MYKRQPEGLLATGEEGDGGGEEEEESEALPREFENHANLAGVLSSYLSRPGGVAHFFANQERSSDAVDLFVSAAEGLGMAVRTSWVRVDGPVECEFGSEARPGGEYLHLGVRWAS